MKFLYTLFITVVMVLVVNSSVVVAQTNEELIIQCEDKKDIGACMELSNYYGNAKDYTTAYKYINKACNGGEMTGCLIQGSLYLQGMGVKKDPKKAVKYYDKACNNGEMVGCGMIGAIYEEGIEVEINFKKALKYYQLACVGGEPLGCSSYEELYDNIETPVKCEEYKDMDACVTAGEEYAENDDFKNSLKYLKKACDGDEMLGCGMQGYLYYEGMGVKQDYKKALKLYNKSCNGGTVEICGLIGKMYEDGVGVDINFTKALELYTKSCEGGNDDGCDSFKTLYEKECSTGSTDIKPFCEKYKK